MSAIAPGSIFHQRLAHNNASTRWKIVCPACSQNFYFEYGAESPVDRSCAVSHKSCKTKWAVYHTDTCGDDVELRVVNPGPRFKVAQGDQATAQAGNDQAFNDALNAAAQGDEPARSEPQDGGQPPPPQASQDQIEDIIKQCEDAHEGWISGDRADTLQAAIVACKETIAASVQPRNVDIKFDVVKPRKAKKAKGLRHKFYEDLLFTLSGSTKKAFLVGPAGTGKTTLAEQVAEDLSLEFTSLSCTEGLSEVHVSGRPLPDGGFLEAQFLKVYENGGLILLDELDACDQNFALIFNAAIEQGWFPVPLRHDKPVARRHAECYIVCTANTFGNGADLQYAGRNQQDGALLSRFAGLTIYVSYDADLERAFGVALGVETWLPVYWGIQKNVGDYKVEQVVSPRWLLLACELRKKALDQGKDWEFLQRHRVTYALLVDRVTVGWSEEEKAKALDGVEIPHDPQDPSGEPISPQVDVHTQPGEPSRGTPSCPDCGAPTVLKENRQRHTHFWGCSAWKPRGRGCGGALTLQKAKREQGINPPAGITS